MGAAMFAFSGSSSAAVSAVMGSAYGYSLNVSLFGGPPSVSGPAPTVGLAPVCDPESGAPTTRYCPPPSPGPQTATQPSAAAAVGPATFFTSGKLDVSTQGTTGPDGSVTSIANVANITGAAGEVFTATNVHTACTALETNPTTTTAFPPTTAPPPNGQNYFTIYTAITGGTLQTDSGDDQNGDGDFTDPGEHAPVTVPVPDNPPINTVIPGHIHVNGAQDSFEYVFNELVMHQDGSVTVYAAHQRLLGPTAVGDLFIGKVECGVTATPDTSSSSSTSSSSTSSSTMSSTTPPPGPECLGARAPIVGTGGDDVLEGTPGDDVIVGLGGNDLIRGMAGDDVICGGAGNDRLAGGSGNDRLSGGSDDDHVDGGSGNDALRGNDGDDRIIGGAGDDLLDGRTGIDDCRPGDGANTVLNCEPSGGPPA